MTYDANKARATVVEIKDKAADVKDRAVDAATDAIDTAKTEASNLKDTLVKGASDIASTVSAKLKDAGIDSNAVVQTARDQMTDLQRLLSDELRARPMRALGVAAAIGLVVGMITAR